MTGRKVVDVDAAKVDAGPVADLARGSGHAGGYRVPIETPEREVEVTGVGALGSVGEHGDIDARQPVHVRPPRA